MLEVFDEMGLTPDAIAGRRSARCIGLGLCVGHERQGNSRHAKCCSHNDRSQRCVQRKLARGAICWRCKAFDVRFAASRARRSWNSACLPDYVPENFEDTGIPFTVIATDIYARRECDR